MKKLVLSLICTLLTSSEVKSDIQTTVVGNIALGAIVNVLPDETVGYVGACALFALYNGHTFSWSTPFLALPSYAIGAKVGKTTKLVFMTCTSLFDDKKQEDIEVIHHHHYYYEDCEPAAPAHQSPAAPNHNQPINPSRPAQ
jgi:hypothetical protein